MISNDFLAYSAPRAPQNGWASPFILGLLALSAASGTLFVVRTLRVASPIVDLTLFLDRSFAVGCALSCALGIGLFGTIYLMPVFLGVVRNHSSLEIGEIMLVTGVAQLVTAPLAVVLESRVDSRLLSVAGSLSSASVWVSALSRRATRITAECSGRK